MNRRVAVCGIAKLENHYIKEWVDHHLSLGFDKIFIYDNNDTDGEWIKDAVQESPRVKIIDARGKKDYQVEAYDDCYQTYGKDFDWMLFIDIDEFFTLNKHSTVQEYLNEYEQHFGDALIILYRWKYYDDNNLVKVENNNYNLLNRLTHPAKTVSEDMLCKQLVKTNIPGLHVNAVHQLKPKTSPVETKAEMINDQANLRFYDGTGYYSNGLDMVTQAPAYLKHFKFKTIQEYLDFKCIRGYPMPYKNSGIFLGIREFFNNNQFTIEKYEFVKQWVTEHQDINPVKLKLLQNEIEEIKDWSVAKDILNH